jgi:hypothetical protein
VQSPPALYILQDSLFIIEQGQTAAHVPFTICNGDACADPVVYDYAITSTGPIGGGFPQTGSTSPVPGGSCEDIHGIVDAGGADICGLDTLTIVVWDSPAAMIYDTCMQVVHVTEQTPVPLISTQLLVALVAVMLIAGIVMLRVRAASASR